jgi:predicted enzyme related to lactoylglutathione lyase/quercetin dioxygenase-like cupin family protein
MAHGKICYLEIPANRAEDAARFYSDIFGWQVRERGDGNLAFDDPGGVSGTWVKESDRTPDERTRTYIMVDSIADALGRIESAGGRVLTPRTDIGSGMGAFAAFTDPVGNEFGLYEEPAATSAVAAPRPARHALDAMAKAAAHHFLLLDNDKVRVLDTRVEPGQRTPVHAHEWPAALYVLSWSDFVRRDPDGKVLLDSRATGMKPAVGSALWGPPIGPHFVENVGDAPLHILAVEIKE